MIELIEWEGALLALIVRAGFRERGVHFFTPEHLSQQLAYMRHPAGHLIAAHRHTPVARQLWNTQEVLLLRRGRLRVDFYTPAGDLFTSRELGSGDVILLVAGGHGFEVLEEVEMIEVKQGPYAGPGDKQLLAEGP